MAKKKEVRSRSRIQPKDADINGSAEIMMKKDAHHKPKKKRRPTKEDKKN